LKRFLQKMESKVDEWWNLGSPDDDDDDDDDDGGDFLAIYESYEEELNKTVVKKHIESIEDEMDDYLFASIITDKKKIGVPISTPKLPGSMFRLDECSFVGNKKENQSFHSFNKHHHHTVIKDINEEITLSELTTNLTADIVKLKATFGLLEDSEYSIPHVLLTDRINDVDSATNLVFSKRIEEYIAKSEKDGRFHEFTSCESHQQLVDQETTSLSDTFHRLKALQTELDERTRRLTELMEVSSSNFTVAINNEFQETTIHSSKMMIAEEITSGLELKTASKLIVSTLNVALDTLLTALPDTNLEIQVHHAANHTISTTSGMMPNDTPATLTDLSQPSSSDFAARLDAIDKALNEDVPIIMRESSSFSLRPTQTQSFNSPILSTQYSPFVAAGTLQPLTVVHSSTFKKDLSRRATLFTTRMVPSEINKRVQKIQSSSSTEWRGTRLQLKPEVVNPTQKAVLPVGPPKQQIPEVPIRSDRVNNKHDECTLLYPSPLAIQATQPMSNLSFYASEMAEIISKENYLRKLQALKQSLVISM